MKLEPVRFQRTRQGLRDLDGPNTPAMPMSGGPIPTSARIPNTGEGERLLSFLGGAALIGAGLAQRSVGGLLMGFIGSAFVQRGWTGYCSLYHALGVNRADPTTTPEEMAYVRG